MLEHRDIRIIMSDFNNTSKLVSLLGDYWGDLYPSKDQVFDYVDSLNVLHKQDDINMQELDASLDRHTIPLYHKELILPFQINESTYLAQRGAFANFDGTYNYNGATVYGEALDMQAAFYPPENVAEVESVANSPSNPTWEQVPEIDSYGRLVLDVSPFSGVFPIENLYNEKGEVSDRRVTLWLKNVSVDNNDVYNQLGYAMGVKLPTSEPYLDILNAMADSLVDGPTEAGLMQFLSATTGIPVVKGVCETVTAINGNVVSTDSRTYTLNMDDTVNVSVGAILNRGTPFSEGLALFKPADSVIDVPAIALDKGITGLCSAEPVIVPNAEKSLQYTQEEDYLKTVFPVEGSNASEFNDLLHERGVSSIKEVDSQCIIDQLNKLMGITPVESPEEESSDQAGFYDIQQVATGIRSNE